MSIIQLKKIRINKGLSQEELADLIGMSQCNYSRRENGKKKITEAEWKKIAQALNVKIEDIYSSEFQDATDLSSTEPKINCTSCLFVKYILKLEKENAYLKEKTKQF